jgi:hypothetical protein
VPSAFEVQLSKDVIEAHNADARPAHDLSVKFNRVDVVLRPAISTVSGRDGSLSPYGCRTQSRCYANLD